MDAKLLKATRFYVAVLVCVLVGGMVAAASAEAKPIKRWTAHNGYHCTKYSHLKRVRAHKHFRMWPKVGTRSHTVCRLRLHKRHHRHGHGHSSAWVLPRYVVMCESGGNAHVVNRTAAGAANGYPAGLYQITGPTWRAYGGLRFAYSADGASVYEQGVIALRVLHAQGPRAWACW